MCSRFGGEVTPWGSFRDLHASQFALQAALPVARAAFRALLLSQGVSLHDAT